ncbi:MAG: NAD(P)-dependent alcohol dehydrogenase [Blastocatellia bacterium]|nr:NAD(P)-dependent alcohol dehydrogenase [Blastocatellia bacterium]
MGLDHGCQVFLRAQNFSEAQSAIAKKPTNVSHEEAAAVGCAGLTAHRALMDIGRIKKNTSVVIIGGSGGVGSYAIQLAKALGANVTAITSSNNTKFVKSLGADTVIDYKKEKFTDLVREQDLVFDTIGRESLKRCSKVLNRNGRYITTIPNPSNLFQSLFSQTLRFLRGGRGQTSHTVLVRANGEALAQIAAMLSSGKVRSIIDTVYPVSEAGRALEKSRSWRSRGKLILRVCES